MINTTESGERAGITGVINPELEINGTLEKLADSPEVLKITDSRYFKLGEILIGKESDVKTYNMLENNGHFNRLHDRNYGAAGNLVSTEREAPLGQYEEKCRLVYLLGLVIDGNDPRIIFSEHTALDYAGEIFPLVKTVSLSQSKILQTFEEKLLRGYLGSD